MWILYASFDLVFMKRSSLFHLMELWLGAAPLLSVNSNDFLMEGNGRKQMVRVADSPL